MLVLHACMQVTRAACVQVRVPRSYEEFLDILIERFPHEEQGIRGFYGECWTVRPRRLHACACLRRQRKR